MESIWIEKWRPTSLADFVGNRSAIEKLQGLVENGNIMHLLLSGPPGIGKTSSLHCIARALLGELTTKALLELNAADDRGIDVVRDRIKNFAKEKIDLPEGTAKIIILDEVDSMTDSAQQALRRLMEKYSGTTRFALACNQSDKVIDAIQSRCAVLRLSRIDDKELKRCLSRICKAENVPFTEEALDVICEASEGDMRKAIGSLQAAAAAFGAIQLPSIYEACDVAPSERLSLVLKSTERGEWWPAHQEVAKLLAEGYSAVDILKGLASLIDRVEDNDLRRVQARKEITFAKHRMASNKLTLLQIDKLVCRLCLFKAKIIQAKPPANG